MNQGMFWGLLVKHGSTQQPQRFMGSTKVGRFRVVGLEGCWVSGFKVEVEGTDSHPKPATRSPKP